MSCQPNHHAENRGDRPRNSCLIQAKDFDKIPPCAASRGGRKALKMKSEMNNGIIGAIVGDIAGSRFELDG